MLRRSKGTWHLNIYGQIAKWPLRECSEGDADPHKENDKSNTPQLRKKSNAKVIQGKKKAKCKIHEKYSQEHDCGKSADQNSKPKSMRKPEMTGQKPLQTRSHMEEPLCKESRKTSLTRELQLHGLAEDEMKALMVDIIEPLDLEEIILQERKRF